MRMKRGIVMKCILQPFRPRVSTSAGFLKAVYVYSLRIREEVLGVIDNWLLKSSIWRKADKSVSIKQNKKYTAI